MQTKSVSCGNLKLSFVRRQPALQTNHPVSDVKSSEAGIAVGKSLSFLLRGALSTMQL